MTALLVKSTLAMMVALFLMIGLRRSRASLRHLVLAALFGFLLLLPPVQQFAPMVQIPVNTPVVERVQSAARSAGIPSTLLKAGLPAGEPASSRREIGRQDAGGPAAWKAALRVYAGGAMLLLLWLAIGVWRLRRLADSGEVWLEGTATMNALANDAGIRRAALVILSPDVAVPLTFGFRRSTIVVPLAAQTWDDEELARALRHELEHVRRDDWALQLMARAACAVYWPNPLAWVAWRRFCLEAERACDDAVVDSYAPDAYAGQLVTLARSLKRMMTVPALGMAGRSGLAHRVDAILDPRQLRGPHGRAAAAAVLVVMLALLASIAPAHLISAAVFSPDDAHRGDRGWSWAGERLVEEAEAGNMEAMRQMLDAGFDVNTVALGDGTALIGAARSGQMEMVRFLIDRGADVNLPAEGDGNPLIAAARGGHLEVLRELLDRGARIDDVVPGDENALITACRSGQADAARLLIDRGANVNARVFVTDSDDAPLWRTPLSVARRGRYTTIVQMLIAAGAKD